MTEQPVTGQTDSRPFYRAALAWASDVAAHVPADRMADKTPCAEWTVRELLGHLVATVDRARVVGEGGDPQTMPRVATGVADDGWADALAAAEYAMAAVWADDARLDAPVTVPWGRVPGREAVWGYAREALVHGWDLAVATGQGGEADPVTATAVLAETRRTMPASPRGGPIPFASPAQPRPGAGPTEELANWCGHARM
jgi:uncharacterized protein (TIGR03086 family)